MLRGARWALLAVLLYAGSGTVSAFHKAQLIALGLNDLASVCLGGSEEGASRLRVSGGHCSLCALSGSAPLQATVDLSFPPPRMDAAPVFARSAPPARLAFHRADLPRAPPPMS